MAIILAKEKLNADTVSLDLDCPLIAAKAQAGQFIILRINDQGERIPLTINDTDGKQRIRIIFQTIGKTTMLLGDLKVGDDILNVVGPLGKPTEIADKKRIAIVVGGLGCAIGQLTAKQAYHAGKAVDIIAGFRTKELMILTKEMRKVSDNLYLCSDDGSYGYHGFVSGQLAELLPLKNYDLVYTIGPLPMMSAVSKVTQPLGVATIASMNPIMIDGSGMCGCCRVTVGGKVKFACVDGPDFPADQVDFAELMARNNFYRDQENQAREAYCKLLEEVKSD